MIGNGANVRIRPMCAEDLPQVIEIEQALKGVPHWTRSAWERVLDPGAARRRLVVVAEDPETGAVLGFAVAAVAAPEGELEAIAVASECQRRGVAKRLFAGLANALRLGEVWEVFLEVRASNHSALAFYRALGFTETGRRAGYYANPDEDAILMRLRLK